MTPSAYAERSGGVSLATSAMPALTVPVTVPWMILKISSWCTLRTAAISATITAPAIIERRTIIFRPYRSATIPQINANIAIGSAIAAMRMEDHRTASGPAATPRSCTMKNGRNGITKAKPAIEMNWDAHTE